MDTFYEPLLELEAFGQIREQLKKEEGLQLITGCVDSQKTHLMYSLGRDWPVKLILTYNELKAKEIYEEYEALGEDVYYYPARDFLFFQADIQGNELLRQRVSAVSSLLSGEKSVIITTLDGCMDPLLPLKKWRELMVTIGVGSILEMDACGKRLVQMGYERTGQVELPGQFAIRGGILDIYPLTEEYPVRIELWDDEVDSIRSFDAQSQRSMENLEEITGNEVLYDIPSVEPLGPKGLADVLVIAPATGNTIGKLANGIADTAVTMAAKSHLRNGRPVVLAVSTNDGLAGSAKNIGELLVRKNYYFVPFGQDDPKKKPTSLVADFQLINETVESALLGRQLQPLLK